MTLAFAASVADADQPLKVLIYTDNANIVSVFNSLHAFPKYNVLLKYAVDLLINGDHDLKVQHISESDNHVADLISRQQFDKAQRLFPSLSIETFLPWDVLGDFKK